MLQSMGSQRVGYDLVTEKKKKKGLTLGIGGIDFTKTDQPSH